VRFIRDYRPPRGKDSLARLECDLWYMEQIYFQHNRDGDRRKPVIERVLSRRPEWKGYEAFILDEPTARSAEWAELDRMSFEALAPGTELTGAAFANNPVARESAGQGQPANHRGRFINSFQEVEADAATGTLLTPEFPIVGDAITLRVGGGRSLEQLTVELLVDGERRFVATGCVSEMMGRRLWPTTALAGKRARLRLVDNAPGGWGHLLVDELVQWKRQGPPPEPAPVEAHAIDPTFAR
jgi:hypothetical protein